MNKLSVAIMTFFVFSQGSPMEASENNRKKSLAQQNLYSAIADKNISKAEEALRNGASLSHHYFDIYLYGKNPVCFAAYQSDTAMLALFREHLEGQSEKEWLFNQALVCLQDPYLGDPKGFLDTLNFLYSSGANINSKFDPTYDLMPKESQRGYNLLHLHFDTKNNPKVFKSLLAKGIEVNAQNFSGDTALHACTRSESLENIRILLMNRANARLQNDEGYTAIDYAKQARNPKIRELFESMKEM